MAAQSEALRIGVVHGPNLNLLGRREPERYGSLELDEIDRRIATLAAELGASAESFQSNVEGELVAWIQRAPERCHGLLVNAAAYTHTSVAIRDALEAVRVPFIEVHLTNIFARETFRHRSLLSDIAVGVVTGFGAGSYLLALRGLLEYLRRK